MSASIKVLVRVKCVDHRCSTVFDTWAEQTVRMASSLYIDYEPDLPHGWKWDQYLEGYKCPEHVR